MDDTPIIVSALRAESARQARAAGVLSEKVLLSDSKDLRSSAVKIVKVLGTGQVLSRVADGLESGTLLLVPADDPHEAALVAAPVIVAPSGEPDGAIVPPVDPPEGGGDDGLEGPVTDAQVVDILTRLGREEAPHAST